MCMVTWARTIPGLLLYGWEQFSLGFPSLMLPSLSCFSTSGSKTLDYSNGMYDCQSPTSPFMGSLRALHLLEDLRSVLELMDTEERESLRCQIPDSTADSLVEWLHGHLVRRRFKKACTRYKRSYKICNRIVSEILNRYGNHQQLLF